MRSICVHATTATLHRRRRIRTRSRSSTAAATPGLRDCGDGAVHGFGGPDGRRNRAGIHPVRPGRRHPVEWLDDHHLLTRPGDRAAPGRETCRPVRPQTGVRPCCGDLHRCFAVLRSGRQHRGTGGPASRPVDRRWLVPAGSQRHRRRPLRPQSGSRPGHVHLHLPDRRHRRPDPRWGLRQLLVLARHLPGQCADRRGVDHHDDDLHSSVAARCPYRCATGSMSTVCCCSPPSFSD